jgi:DNA-binding helix-hairpin-helix protein with protein kinase domain
LICARKQILRSKTRMMKQNIIVISLSCFSLGGIVSSCSTPAEKVENAKEDVVGAKQELQTSKAAYEEDMVTFRELSDKKIADNKQNINNFNKRIANQKAEARMVYEKKIAALDGKNSDLKKKMDDLKVESEADWKRFKTEFSRDMDDLGIAINELNADEK